MNGASTATRSHVAEIALTVSPRRAFALLITPSDIRRWWGASAAIVLAEEGGRWIAAWGDDEDDPDYITAARIATFEPPRVLALDCYQYRSKTGPLPFDADFTTTFEVEPRGDGVRIRVTQDGFPVDAVADDFYAACERGWHDTLEMMQRYVSSSQFK